jgi:hypothetical protein
MFMNVNVCMLIDIENLSDTSYINIYWTLGIENVSGMDFSGAVIKQMQQRTIDLKLPFIHYFEVIIYVFIYVYLLWIIYFLSQCLWACSCIVMCIYLDIYVYTYIYGMYTYVYRFVYV